MRAALASFLLLFAASAHGAMFDQMRVYATGGKSMTNWHGQADVQSLSLEMTRSFSKRTAAGVIVTPMSLWQPRSWFGDLYDEGSETVHGINASLVGRRTFHPDSRRAQFFVEISSGPMWSQKRVPAATSHFNFVSAAGFGFVLKPDSRYPLIAGYRFMHISNGGYAPRNPGLNISAAMVGVQFGR